MGSRWHVELNSHVYFEPCNNCNQLMTAQSYDPSSQEQERRQADSFKALQRTFMIVQYVCKPGMT